MVGISELLGQFKCITTKNSLKNVISVRFKQFMKMQGCQRCESRKGEKSY